jgi:methionine-rich copper-binding protein CopC
MGSSTGRRSLGFLAGMLLVGASVLLVAAPASAHNYLVSSTPSAGEKLITLPSKFVITTNEGLLDLSGHGAGFALQVRDASGLYYGDGCVTVTGPTMSVPAKLGKPGKYTVTWQIVSADGHIVSNAFAFTWAPTGSPTVSTGTAKPADCGGKSGGSAPADPSLGSDTTKPANANLGLVLGIGGGAVGLGLILTVVLLVTGRRRKPE